MEVRTQRLIRRCHLYLGVFFAPTLLLFALSGAVQVFRLHEAGGWGGKSPPYWLAWIGAVHKNQALPRPEPAPTAGREDHTSDHSAGHARNSTTIKAGSGKRASRSFALEVFTGLMGVGLIGSTLLGIAIALTTRATRRPSLAILALGAMLPLLFLYF